MCALFSRKTSTFLHDAVFRNTFYKNEQKWEVVEKVINHPLSKMAIWPLLGPKVSPFLSP